ncbi:MAG: aminodeoxychorismate synthase, component I [Lentisphaerae bacterium GWF2_45_14]|nr:MAG: aminodeoxychorismate synthase, component I [Lentisphaerae bacterium GWF2_45_14]
MKSGEGKLSLSSRGTVISRLPGDNLKWGIFSNPLEVLESVSPCDVRGVLESVNEHVREGRAAAGFISYEAAPAFDRANKVKMSLAAGMPLVWFGIYDSFREFEFSGDFSPEIPVIVPEMDNKSYLDSIGLVKDYIFEGDIYQANFTFRLRGNILSQPDELFLSLFGKHPAPYSAFVNTGKIKIVSNSPELFIESENGMIKSMPMKGTFPRSPFPDEDAEAARRLSSDPKNNAENLMITDMVRNDLGRICVPGTVKTGPLFHVDTYATLHQMISTVCGKLSGGLSLYDIFSAVFPAASITGAPKIRAMEIIEQLEKSPRGIYTGTIGCVLPGGSLCFNVAIRTLAAGQDGACELGVGGGIVADSIPSEEWTEALLKSKFLFKARDPEFKVLETILWKDGVFSFLEEHLKRAESSQLYFGRKFDKDALKEKLLSFSSGLEKGRFRVRMLLDPCGNAELVPVEIKGPPWPSGGLKIKLSEKRTLSSDIFLYHKTTNRAFYDKEFADASADGFNEVIFANEKGEITEGAVSNIFIEKNSRWYTPELPCGLLSGIWRGKMISELAAEETKISISDLRNAEKIIIGNSVRGTGNVLETSLPSSVLNL